MSERRVDTSWQGWLYLAKSLSRQFVESESRRMKSYIDDIAADAVGETFKVVAAKGFDLDEDRGLVYNMLRWRIRNAVKRYSKHCKRSLSWVDIGVSAPTFDDAVDDLDDIVAELAKKAELTEVQRRVFELHFAGGYSVKAISELFGTTTRAVQRVLSRARRRVAENYDGPLRG